MKTEIRIEIQNEKPESDAIQLITMLMTVPICVYLFVRTRTNVWMTIALLVTAFVLIYRLICQSRKTVVKSDGDILWWQDFGKPKMLKIDEIAEISCTPYEVRTRFGSRQRLRLTLQTDGSPAQAIEFTDNVDSMQLMQDQLGGTETDIPLARLYRYLRARLAA